MLLLRPDALRACVGGGVLGARAAQLVTYVPKARMVCVEGCTGGLPGDVLLVEFSFDFLLD